MSSLFNVVENDWGEITYVPTTLGNVLLAVVIIVLIGAGIAITLKRQKDATKKQKLTAKQIAVCAVAIALGTILSNIKVFRFPTGGSITLFSMLVICLPGLFYGTGVGVLTGVAYGVLQMIIDPYILYPSQLVVDYILAFGALGLAGVFRDAKNGFVKGYILGIIGRFVFAVISGFIFFGSYAWDGWNPLAYSIVYNAIYIFSEGIVTVLVMSIPAVKTALGRIKNTVLEAN